MEVTPDENVVHTVATYRVREMELAQDINLLTEHGDRVVIPGGTLFKLSELVRFETQWPEDRAQHKHIEV